MTTNSPEPLAQIDLPSLLERVEGDRELLEEMIQLFADDAPVLLETMRKALEQGDMVKLERSAHSMKGAAGNLSANFVMAAASELEKNAKVNDAEASRASLANVEGTVSRLLPVLGEISSGVLK